jgi:hypothetical protein
MNPLPACPSVTNLSASLFFLSRAELITMWRSVATCSAVRAFSSI